MPTPQRPIQGSRNYIALYRDRMGGTLEDVARLVLPQQEAKQKAFIQSITKKNEETKRDADAIAPRVPTGTRYTYSDYTYSDTFGDQGIKRRPLSEMVDKMVRNVSMYRVFLEIWVDTKEDEAV